MGLTRTWGVLMALSGVSTGIAALVSEGGGGQVAVAAILLLAWIKAHLILKTYLGLRAVRPVLRGFDVALGLAVVAMLGLAFAG
jgi:hypothetical protein